jgi:hypothetical protein
VLQLTRPTLIGKFYICVHLSIEGFAAILCSKEQGQLRIHDYEKLGSDAICDREILAALDRLESKYLNIKLEAHRQLALYKFSAIYFGELNAIVHSLRKRYRKDTKTPRPFKEQKTEDDDYLRLKLSINSGEVKFDPDPVINSKLVSGVTESDQNDFKVTPLIAALMIAAKVFRKNDSSFGGMKV